MIPSLNETIMRRCLELARRAWGDTHPNPMVGAAIVEAGEVVAEGWHHQAGQAHAEIEALRALGRRPEPDARLFVTLEPCSTEGRTGPCTQAIIEAGIRHVVVGAIDPNPEHAGKGLDILKAAGVTVESRVLVDDCEDLNLIFNHWITKRTPLIAGKMATTIDGRTATRTGDSKWITGAAARQDVHRWRRLFPAIAIGAGTVVHDKPRLTARLEGTKEWCPVRFVFDSMLRTAAERELSPLYTDEFREFTVVIASEQAGVGYKRKIENAGAQVWMLPGLGGKISFPDFRERCIEKEITGIYVEGGAQVMSELLQTREIDYLFAYRAPLLFADQRALAAVRGLRTEKLDHALRLDHVRHATFGDDQLVRGFVNYPGRLAIDETALT